MPNPSAISEQVEQITASGALGRSRVYERLLAYLGEASAAGRTAREIDIAADVFGKGSEFDSSQDSAVRVYVHNLRQKLDKYYTDAGIVTPRLTIPRGEYRLELHEVETVPSRPPAPGRRWLALATGALAAISVTMGIWIATGSSAYSDLARTPMWAPILGDDQSILVVMGDYYIFAELDRAGNVERMVREFNVNSSVDLDDLAIADESRRYRYMDLDLTYLPRGAAFALADLLQVVYAADKPVRIIPSSEVRIDDLRRNHVIYVGYISALGSLMDFVFRASSLEVGDTFDELVHRTEGTYYRSSAGLAGHANYKDYGLISRFTGPGGHQVLIVAGTRDSGLMHSARVLVDAQAVAQLQEAKAEHASFEALFEVTGFDHMPLQARLIHHGPIEAEGIWGGEATSR